MYRYTNGMRKEPQLFSKRSRRILLGLLAFFMAAAIVLTVFSIRSMTFENSTNKQFSQRMMNCVSSAIEQVNKMSSVVNSGTSSKLALVRQYVYAMDQFNQISIALLGEKGRLAPSEAFTALYSDIESYEALTQTATTSTLDARTLLLTHLTNLQTLLEGTQN